jgi:hypothetical protein
MVKKAAIEVTLEKIMTREVISVGWHHHGRRFAEVQSQTKINRT